jgi:hypothetical protein
MKKKPQPEKREGSRIAHQSSPRGETFGVAPIEPDAFSRRAGEIIAKAVAPSDEKAKRRSK